MAKEATCSNCLRLFVDNIDSHQQLFKGVPSLRKIRWKREGLLIEYCFSPVGPDHYKRIEHQHLEK
jgi:hypothetical protein